MRAVVDVPGSSARKGNRDRTGRGFNVAAVDPRVRLYLGDRQWLGSSSGVDDDGQFKLLW